MAKYNNEQRQRKRNMLQMWSTGPLCKGLQSGSLQRHRHGWRCRPVQPTTVILSTTMDRARTVALRGTIVPRSAAAYNQEQQPPQMPTAPAQAVSTVEFGTTTIASVTTTGLNTYRTVELMIDSGAAVHVCPPTFGTDFPLMPLTEEQTPPLRSVADEPLWVLGYRWVRFKNIQGQHLVMPFYVIDGIRHPIVSVTRLLEQGFELNLRGTESTLQKGDVFQAPLTSKDRLLYIHLETAPMEEGTKLVIQNTPQGQVAMIAPTHTHLQQQDHDLSKGATTTFGSTTNQDTWSEYTREEERHCSHQDTATNQHVQYNLTDWTTTGKRLSTKKTVHTQCLKTSSSHSPNRKQTERLQVHNGKEKHGSGFFLTRQQQANRNRIQTRNDKFRNEWMKERK